MDGIKQGVANKKTNRQNLEAKINQDEEGGGDNRSLKAKGKKMADAKKPDRGRKHGDLLTDDMSGDEDGARDVRGLGKGSGEGYLGRRRGGGRDTMNRSGGRGRGYSHGQDRDRERSRDIVDRNREQRRGHVRGRGRGQGQSPDRRPGHKDINNGRHQKPSSDMDNRDVNKTKNKPTKRGGAVESLKKVGITAAGKDGRSKSSRFLPYEMTSELSSKCWLGNYSYI